jgi:hypothetical protein
LAIVCLVAAAASHVPLIPAHWQEARYAGVAFVLFVVASAALAIALAGHDTVVVWTGVVVLETFALGAFVLTRLVALPALADDVGSWREPLSFPAVAAELIALVVAASVLGQRKAARA